MVGVDFMDILGDVLAIQTSLSKATNAVERGDQVKISVESCVSLCHLEMQPTHLSRHGTQQTTSISVFPSENVRTIRIPSVRTYALKYKQCDSVAGNVGVDDGRRHWCIHGGASSLSRLQDLCLEKQDTCSDIEK